MEFLQTVLITLTLQGGYIPEYTFALAGVQNSFIQDQRFFNQTEVEISALDNLFYTKFGTRTDSTKASGITFSPKTDLYTAGAGIRLNGFEVGCRKSCSWSEGSRQSL
jgi:hypothetical protein